MIPAIVFSRDRACQLDGLLQTLGEHAPGLFSPLRVLYTTSAGEFESGYRRCARRHPWAVQVRESVFREDVMALLPADGPVCFFTDDDLLYGWVQQTAIDAALQDQDVIAFSLRLGLNTRRCYPLDTIQHLPPVEQRDGFLTWQWAQAEFDFGYPLSLDGHVLRAEDVRALIDGADFTSPNQLEDVLAHQAHRLLWRPLLAAQERSVLVGVPVNRVNETHQNRFGSWRSYPVRDLNDRYLGGDIIDPSSMSFDVSAAHQEIELAFDFRDGA